MTVELVSITPDAEKTMAYIARVSNPSNQDNEKFAGLLKYCIKHNHWSVFEQSSMTLSIETTRAIAAQILRHRSFTFQEFSQRYAASTALGTIELPELRKQDLKNRQNSTDDLDPKLIESLNKQMDTLFGSALALYNLANLKGFEDIADPTERAKAKEDLFGFFDPDTGMSYVRDVGKLGTGDKTLDEKLAATAGHELTHALFENDPRLASILEKIKDKTK